jgi:hypothetical protein
MTVNTRPTGITVLAVLSAIGGVLGILGGSAAVFGGAFLGVAGAAAGVGALGGLLAVVGLIILALSIAQLFLAYGFWTIKPWAWRLGVALSAASIAFAVLQFLAVRQDFVGLLISVAINGIILYYLNQPEIRRLFNAPASGFDIR